MADKNNCTTALGHILHLAEAALLELNVSNRQDFVDEKDLCVEMGGHGKRQAEVHTRGISFDRRVNELFDPGEGDDVIEPRPDLFSFHSENRTIEKHVLSTGQFGMKTRAHLKQRTDPAIDFRPATCWSSDSSK